MSEHEHGICDVCLRENPGASSYEAVPLGGRCSRHTVRPATPAPRWREIATEGLPPRGERVLLLNLDATGDDAVPFIGLRDGVWFNATLDVIDEFEDEGPVATHWHPLPKGPR